MLTTPLRGVLFSCLALPSLSLLSLVIAVGVVMFLLHMETGVYCPLGKKKTKIKKLETIYVTWFLFLTNTHDNLFFPTEEVGVWVFVLFFPHTPFFLIFLHFVK